MKLATSKSHSLASALVQSPHNPEQFLVTLCCLVPAGDHLMEEEEEYTDAELLLLLLNGPSFPFSVVPLAL